MFSFDELKKVTNNFSEANDIGTGGYGKVKKPLLITSDAFCPPLTCSELEIFRAVDHCRFTGEHFLLGSWLP